MSDAGAVRIAKLAAPGQRNLDTGPDPIADVAELAQVRRQARAVHAKSGVALEGGPAGIR